MNNFSLYHKNSPCLCILQEREQIGGNESTSKTFHLSLNIENTQLHFHPGDSLGVLPENDPFFVSQLLLLLHTSENSLVYDPRSQKQMSAHHYLSACVNFSRISSALIHFLESKIGLPLPDSFTAGKDLLDLLESLALPSLSLAEIQPFLAPLLPRFYSISSCLQTHPKQVDLLVALASYNHPTKGLQYGVASHFLCHLAKIGHTSIPVYVQPTKHFTIPSNPSHSLLMIGPGTGVAPYRAFLQRRIAQQASGSHWLIFGGRHQDTDFLYKDFWQTAQEKGILKLSTAFSRDQEEKIYVQHRLLEEASTVWKWLESGCFVYVCGDASRMAKDVEAALLQIIHTHQGLGETEAKQYIKKLRSEGRYVADVY